MEPEEEKDLVVGKVDVKGDCSTAAVSTVSSANDEDDGQLI